MKLKQHRPVDRTHARPKTYPARLFDKVVGDNDLRRFAFLPSGALYLITDAGAWVRIKTEDNKETVCQT